MRLLLDTCVISELQKPTRSKDVTAFIASVPDEYMHISVITLGEITKGIALLPDGAKKHRLIGWRSNLAGQFADRILNVDEDTAEIWGELTATGHSKGTPIPAADGLIAATALRHGLHVATRNEGHFAAAGAMVINPWKFAA